MTRTNSIILLTSLVVLLAALLGCSSMPVVDDIPNLRQVTPHAWRSGQPVGVAQWGSVVHRGVKYVLKLDCDDEAGGRDDLDAQYAGLQVYRFCLHPRTDRAGIVEIWKGPNDLELQALDFIAQVIASDDPPLLWHCVNGRERTGLLAGMVVRYKYGWTREQAYAYMLETGFRPLAVGIARSWDRWNRKIYRPLP